MNSRARLAACAALLLVTSCNDDDDASAPSSSRAEPSLGQTPTASTRQRSSASMPVPNDEPARTRPATAPLPAPTEPGTTPARTPDLPVATSVSPTVPPPPTTVPPTPPPTPPPTSPAADPEVAIELGQSVEGRPIEVIRRGTPGGVPILAVGVIHGDEDAGSLIVETLRRMPVPDGIELWLVPSMNPDGQAAGVRQNANGVDLNRNFPTNWGPVAQPGDWQYAGTEPASEPEVQAMVALAELVNPRLTLWYHQDLFRINPADGRDGEIRARYAELTRLPIVPVTGGTYTGTASQWSRTIAAPGGVGFTVELGKSLDADGARRHADAVLTIATEL